MIDVNTFRTGRAFEGWGVGAGAWGGGASSVQKEQKAGKSMNKPESHGLERVINNILKLTT